ncbi:hypothetical protein BDV12DRAFT_42067 [Aspergillus spectabilis]
MYAPLNINSQQAARKLKVYEFDENNPNDLKRRAVNQSRPMKVIVLGTGMSGIIAGIFFPREIENLDLVIYDKNTDLGGTWFESRYPGIACDVPAHAYQFTFESNTQWSSFWPKGPEINAYLKSVATKYDAIRYMKFGKKCDQAVWNETTGQWSVYMTDLETGMVFVDTCDVLISATGALNKWNWPDIAGLHSFKGKLVHSADWDTTIDVTGKRVALVGGGSSGIQILPQIQPKASEVLHFMRGKTWIPPVSFGAQSLRLQGNNAQTPADLLEKFKNDPQSYIEFRRKIESDLHSASEVIYKDTEMARTFQKMCEEHMRSKLAKKPEILDALLPDYPVACRRLTPGPGYLEALVQDNVKFIPEGLEVYEDGVITKDGTRHEVDIIITATGYAGYGQPFPLYGQGGTNLQALWDNDVPEAYMSLAPQKMPNYFCFLGPNGGPGLGSTVPFLEAQGKYMIQCIKKLQREWLKSMVIKYDAVKAFGAYVDRFLEPTVYNGNCRVWWRHKGNGRLLAMWPGSALHGMYAWANPRWEDFDYELKEEQGGNPFNWLGNGYVTAQLVGDVAGMTFYLDDDKSFVPVKNPLLAGTSPAPEIAS